MKSKTLREDAPLAVRKISLCEPLVRGESRKRDFFYVIENIPIHFQKFTNLLMTK